MHGWSGDSRTWEHWMTYFQTFDWHWQNGERGYGCLKPVQPKWHKQNSLSIQRLQVNYPNLFLLFPILNEFQLPDIQDQEYRFDYPDEIY